MYPKIILFASLCMLSVTGFSRENTADTLKYNIHESSLYGSLGMAPIFLNAMANYEIMLAKRPDKIFKTRGLRIGAGIWEIWEDAGWTCMVSYTCLTGAGNNHFELGIGAAFWQYLTLDHKYVIPALNLGYRYQKPDGKFIFRTGGGFPESAYLSFGYCFN